MQNTWLQAGNPAPLFWISFQQRLHCSMVPLSLLSPPDLPFFLPPLFLLLHACVSAYWIVSLPLPFTRHVPPCCARAALRFDRPRPPRLEVNSTLNAERGAFDLGRPPKKGGIGGGGAALGEGQSPFTPRFRFYLPFERDAFRSSFPFERDVVGRRKETTCRWTYMDVTTTTLRTKLQPRSVAR